MVLLAAIFLLIAAVHAIPVIEFPFNSQFPPVARVSIPFQFVFSEATFSSVEPDAITYSISDSPSWLHLDSSSRTLFGTPKLSDVGTIAFEIIGSDTTGSANMKVTLIVSTDSGTTLNESTPPLRAEDGELSGIASFSVSPSNPFTFSVDPDTFVSPGENTTFFATSADNTPLPSWVRFDSATLTFSGTSPPLSSARLAPQIFNFNLVASDIDSTRSTSSAVKIAVAPHTLTFEKVLLKFNFSAGIPFSTPHLRDSLMIDGKPLRDDDITRVVTDSPEWLTLDEDTLSLSGTAPESADNATAIISVTDVYGDNANITVSFQRPGLFSENISSYDIIAGEDFSYTFKESLLADESIQLDVDPKHSFPWIEYDSTQRTLHGHAPDGMKTQVITIPLLAKKGPTEETKPFTIRVYKANKSCTSSESNSTSVCPNTTPNQGNPTGGTDKITFIIPIVIIIPILILAVGLLFYGRRHKTCFCNRKKRRRAERNQSSSHMKKIPYNSDAVLDKKVHPGSQYDLAAPKFKFDSVNKLRNSLARRHDTSSDEESQAAASMFSQIFSRPVSESEGTVVSEKDDRRNAMVSGSTKSPRRRGSFNPHWPRERGQSAENLDLPPTHKPQATCPHGRKMSSAGHDSSASNPPAYDAVGRPWETAQSSLEREAGLETLTSRFPLPPAVEASESSSSKALKRPSQDSTSTTLLPSPRRFSESERWKMFMHGEPNKGYTINPLLSSQATAPGFLGKSSMANWRSNSWTTTNSSLPGSQNYLRGYPHLSSRSPSFGSVFNIGLGLRRPSEDQSLHHSRARSQRSQGSSGGHHGWMIPTTTARLDNYGKQPTDTHEKEASNSYRRLYSVSSQQQRPAARKYSYPLNAPGGSHTASSSCNTNDGGKYSNPNNTTSPSMPLIPRTRQPSGSSSVYSSDEGNLQPNAREQQRWRLGETQESRYASIRDGKGGVAHDNSGDGPSGGNGSFI